jgi:hypothetical protein
MMPKRTIGAIGMAIAIQTVIIAQEAPMTPLRPDQVAFLALYKELVETNTTLSAGSCTLAAERIAAHLKAAGYADQDITLFSAPDHPKEGGLVGVLPGTSNTAKPMLLLGHLDVVEAKREDWPRDPFTLIEENGYFYGRGTGDMKALDATWVDALMRFDLRFQWRGVAGEEPTRIDFCGVRAQRGRRRAHRRSRQATVGGHSGRREGSAELQIGDRQCRRP